MSPVPVPGATHTWMIGSGAIVYHRSSGAVQPLNATATAIWLLCDGEEDLDAIVAELASLFEADPLEIRGEVESTVAGFTTMGLLVDPGVAAAEAPAPPPISAVAGPASADFVLQRRFIRVGLYSGLGSNFVLETDGADLARLLADRFCDLSLADQTTAPDHRVLVHRGDGQIVHSPWTVEIDGRPAGMGADDDDVLQELLTGLVFNKNSNHPLTFHAAAVSHRGRGVLITGGWGIGKSTTMLALIRAGFGYLADEVTVVDPSTRAVHPWHSPIAQTRDNWRSMGVDVAVPHGCERYLGHHQPVAASSLPFAYLSDGAVLGAILIVAHLPGEQTRVELLDPAYAAARIQATMLVPEKAREAWIHDVVHLAEAIPTYQLTVDDLTPLAGLVAGVLDPS